LYFQLNEFAASRKLHVESIELAEEIGDNINITRNYMGLMRIYMKFSDLEKVELYAEKAIKYAEERKSLKELIRIYDILHSGYKALGHKEASINYYVKLVEYTSALNELEEDNLRMFTNFNNLNYENTELKEIPHLNGNSTVYSKNGNEKYSKVV
jgi:tetratricopeptide (TPR) repeat protein